MANVRQRAWKVPGQRTKHKAWGFTLQLNGKQMKHYRVEWTREDAEAELAKKLLQIEPPKPKGAGITLAQAADRYLATKARKRTVEADRRQLNLLKAEFGAEMALAEITASRISEYKTKRLAAVRKIGEAETRVERGLQAIVSGCRSYPRETRPGRAIAPVWPRSLLARSRESSGVAQRKLPHTFNVSLTCAALDGVRGTTRGLHSSGGSTRRDREVRGAQRVL